MSVYGNQTIFKIGYEQFRKNFNNETLLHSQIKDNPRKKHSVTILSRLDKKHRYTAAVFTLLPNKETGTSKLEYNSYKIECRIDGKQLITEYMRYIHQQKIEKLTAKAKSKKIFDSQRAFNDYTSENYRIRLANLRTDSSDRIDMIYYFFVNKRSTLYESMNGQQKSVFLKVNYEEEQEPLEIGNHFLMRTFEQKTQVIEGKIKNMFRIRHYYIPIFIRGSQTKEQID